MENEKINSKILKSNYIPTAEFYSQIIDSLQDYSIFTLDNEFVINSWSSGSTKIFGYEPDEIIGQHFDVIFTEEDIQNGIPQTEIQAALVEGRATDNRWHICKDRSIFYAYGLVFPLTGIDGEMLGYVKILRDLTERKKSEDAIKKYVKELEDLNTHKENVLAIVSHDLRSPLSGIIGTAEYLKTNLDRLESTKAKEMLDLLHKTAVDELNMLDNLVEWARIKYASEVFSPAKIELFDYAQKVFESLHDAAALNSINLRNEIGPNISVFADGKMLLSVFQNIISNAIKHSLPGGEIIVLAKIEAEKVLIQIKDSGIGMSKDVQSKLFTPQMSTLSKARKDNKGAGIGLLLVKGFLEKNDGEIWVESVEGIGSSFYFTLPLEEPLHKIDSVDKIEFDERV
ncbi:MULTISPECIES: PAS domain-containing sensor histidine kinase [unclassified Flavobacterium]|uniref:PAS domain-containing sensor histidine kinase n=1 Tax=unclassified Flavobacterium TaxID=196869 RepID=UPI000C18F062|nr:MULTISPECIES: PAS domain-containing sensor histidine kinase [unclassified Flavobacterium]PIF62372.1 PAS domain S-box-containing protein [Flavobacterium sp. 11]RKS14695.1 PAS domain S-box-containing protein [Flavobacterium sp. 120]WKL43520.1 PAS domain-containing sensor histidine kinase [Flavobacterium sp. ZE23DGlu08]